METKKFYTRKRKRKFTNDSLQRLYEGYCMDMNEKEAENLVIKFLEEYKNRKENE